MITSKLEQAKRTIENVIEFGKGQAFFEWQVEMLTKQSDQDAATELSAWWYNHPSNPNRLFA